MAISDFIRNNKATTALIGLALVWLLVRNSVTTFICGQNAQCWLLPDSWPTLLGVTSASSAILVGLLAFLLFALPVGRAGLLAILVAINLAKPVFGLGGVFVLFVFSSAASIVLVHAVVEKTLKHPKASWIHLRLEPLKSIFAPSIRKNGMLWLAIGNLVGSQWHMSALGIICLVPRIRIWVGLFTGNLLSFILVLAFSSVPNLDAVSVVLLVLAVALALSSPAFWANWKKTRSSK